MTVNILLRCFIEYTLILVPFITVAATDEQPMVPKTPLDVQVNWR